MLPKYPIEASADTSRVLFRKYSSAHEDVTHFGAFARGEVLTLSVTCPHVLGASSVVLRLWKDGVEPHDTPFLYTGSDDAMLYDFYELAVDTAVLCGDDPSGLFYYRFLFARRGDTLFSDSLDNVNFDLTPYEGAPFRLLIHERDYHVPAWLGNGVLYHLFVDRFFRGEGDVTYRTGERGAELNPDWDHGIPQYADKPGDPLTNHIHFGGNLWGIAEKLDYLASLGVTVLYLSPIFEAYSNHKYDTGDYLTIDRGFGGETAWQHLLQSAHERGMRVILDGVFNHTGDDSRYFDRYGTYGGTGAFSDGDSPYRDWYRFRHWPDEYECWWNIPIMPRLNHQNPVCRQFFTGKDGVCAHYLRDGADGFRLDVADELSDTFLDELRTTVKAASDGEAVVIGEVWENAADKIAYGHRRRYLQGKQLDSVMNYPLREGILSFVRDGSGDGLYHVLTELYASYPREVSDSLMNLIGTHDTERILTVLGADYEDFDRPNAELSRARLSSDRLETALTRLRMAAVLQFTVFGIPSIYYGDEIGMEGFHDPFCRFPFPWKEIDPSSPTVKSYRLELLDFYRRLGELRRSPAFCGGDFRILTYGAHHIVYERRSREGVSPSDRLVVAANRGDEPMTVQLDDMQGTIVLQSGTVSWVDGFLTVNPDSICVVR